MLAKPIVALITNEPTFRWTISRLLESRGFDVTAHERGTVAVDEVREACTAVVVLEATYGSALSATSIVERLRNQRESRHTPIIVCSPDGKFLHSYGEYLRGQGCVVVGRPFNDEQFVELVESVATILAPRAIPVLPETVHHSW